MVMVEGGIVVDFKCSRCGDLLPFYWFRGRDSFACYCYGSGECHEFHSSIVNARLVVWGEIPKIIRSASSTDW